MVFNVLIKGISVGMTHSLQEAQSWTAGTAARDFEIRAIRNEVQNYRTYKA